MIKKYESADDMTAVIPRPLEPLSVVPGPTIEMLADVERSRRDAQDDVDTKMQCPLCRGDGLVTPDQRAEWLARYPELAARGAKENK